MKKVFTGFSEVAHLWANQIQEEARNSGGNFYFNDDTIYSYGSHFPIAKHVTNDKGEKATLFTKKGYSPSTSKHINAVRHASNHLNLIFCKLGNGSRYNSSISSHADNFNYWVALIEEQAAKLAKARKPEIYLNQIASEYAQAKRYAEFFGIAIPATLEAAGNISNKDEYIQFEKTRLELQKQEEIKQAQQIKKDHSKELKLWSTFQKQYHNNTPMRLRNGFDYLRASLDKDRIETSQAVQIPLPLAKRFFDQVNTIIKNGGCTNCNTQFMQYNVREINKDFIIVGCHKISLKEINRLAKTLGWI